ncbi:MAG TPA: YraN family protein [Marinagarivorans sp.]
MKTQLTGAAAEQLARDYLERQGFSVVAQNYRCKQGEIDLVLRQRHLWLFVEVKNRKNTRFGTPSEWVTRSKQRKIILATQHFLAANNIPSNAQIRFDVIGIINLEAHSIEWIQNAFLAN